MTHQDYSYSLFHWAQEGDDSRKLWLLHLHGGERVKLTAWQGHQYETGIYKRQVMPSQEGKEEEWVIHKVWSVPHILVFVHKC